MITAAGLEDLDRLLELALLLWPDNPPVVLREEIAQTLEGGDAAYFLWLEDGNALGFAQVRIRREYVEGTSTSPVGCLEGISVRNTHHGRGIASELLTKCESWARERGLREFASDCALNNTDSLRFHLKNGFLEAGRLICFRKPL